jgi:hypothetical protein
MSAGTACGERMLAVQSVVRNSRWRSLVPDRRWAEGALAPNFYKVVAAGRSATYRCLPLTVRRMTASGFVSLHQHRQFVVEPRVQDRYGVVLV